VKKAVNQRPSIEGQKIQW